MKSRIGDWTDLGVFLAVLRSGSTLAASRSLGIAQPTVTRRIEALEHQLGLVLFERDTRGFHPTATARALAASAEGVEAAVSALDEAARKLASGTSGTIRMIAPVSIFRPKFYGLLAEFQKAHPGVRFDFVQSDQVLDLAGAGIDVAIRAARSLPNDRLICRKLATSRATLFASEDYVARRGLPRSPDDLSGHALCQFTGDPASWTLNAWLMERTAGAEVVASCNDLGSMRAAIEAGTCLGPLPVGFAALGEGLVPCFEPPEALNQPLWLLITADAHRRPEVRAFVDFTVPRIKAVLRLN